MAESIQKELDEYRASEEEVKRLKNVMVGYKVCILVSPEVNGILTWYNQQGNDKMRFWVASDQCFGKQPERIKFHMLWLKSKM